jgi:rhamnogalacturonyl hydrolase YesR
MDPHRVNTGWEDVLIPQGAVVAGQAMQDKELLDWAGRWVQFHAFAGIREPAEQRGGRGIYLNDYCGDWGFPLVASPILTTVNDPELTSLLVRVCDHILTRSTRLRDGIIAHGGWDYASRTVWVDTLYYTASVLAAGFRSTGDIAYAGEAIRQCLLHARFLSDPTTGAFFHDADPESGVRTNWFWSRGNGWVVMALADTLRICPSSLPGWQEVLTIYRSLCTALLRWQQPCGLWRIVPEVDESHLETSGSAMIAIGLTLGVGEGWLHPAVASQVRKTLEELLTWIEPESGALKGAQKPAGQGGWETHKLSNLGECTYATGIFLRLLGETQHYQFI